MVDPKIAWRDQATIDAEQAAKDAEEQRIIDLKADALRQDMVDKLKVATPEQISNFVDNNVNNLADARNMFKRILLVLSTMVRE